MRKWKFEIQGRREDIYRKVYIDQDRGLFKHLKKARKKGLLHLPHTKMHFFCSIGPDYQVGKDKALMVLSAFEKNIFSLKVDYYTPVEMMQIDLPNLEKLNLCLASELSLVALALIEKHIGKLRELTYSFTVKLAKEWDSHGFFPPAPNLRSLTILRAHGKYLEPFLKISRNVRKLALKYCGHCELNIQDINPDILKLPSLKELAIDQDFPGAHLLITSNAEQL